MTLGLFIVVLAIIGALWFIKLSDVLKKAGEADKAEETHKESAEDKKQS